MRALLLLAGLYACGPKAPPPPPPAPPAPPALPAWRTQAPQPLPARPFQLPAAAEGKLKNGIPVSVVENHEVPLVYVRLVLEGGSWTDPDRRPGLAGATMDMMNEGAGTLDAGGLSLALRKVGASLSAGAGLDGSEISVSALADQLPATLDLLATVLLKPTFPASEWKILQSQRLSDLKSARSDPRRISDRIWRATLIGDQYAGRLSQEKSIEAMTVPEMRAWYGEWVRPELASLLVAGDTTLAEISPLLESRFGSWKGKGKAPRVDRSPKKPLPTVEKTTIYLADKPGAAQSVVKVGHFVQPQTAPDQTDWQLADRMIGGQFVARINMNLREEKGWTYGARSGTWFSALPGLWSVEAGIVTAHTGPAVAEILRELKESLTTRPFTAAELATARGSLLGSFPLGYESPGTLLSQTLEMRRYGLPADWITGQPDRLRAATEASVQAAWARRIQPEKLAIVIVGDVATIRPQLEALQLPIVLVNDDGRPVETP